MIEHKLRCGDTARQTGCDYDVEIAYADYEWNRASWCGWPEGTVEIDRLTLVKACSDEEHRIAVSRWLDCDRVEFTDHRRDAVQRLYRPRAYWKAATETCEQRCDEASRALAHAAQKWVDANAGPEDAEPLA